MNLHLVGGFLGSGKTTAIIAAAKLLMAQGLRVGVITNDQGRYLVDTAFVRLANLPAVEVTGGCFCCNYDDLNARLDELVRASEPQVIFAESVGSCADLVATVVKPLLELGGERYAPTSFSAFADARLLLRRLRADELPFSEDVTYIFDKQIEEAGLLVVNKTDLMSAAELKEIETLLPERLPGKPCVFQSALAREGVSAWLERIQSGAVGLPRQSLEIDYRRYAAGEANLGWLDQEIALTVPAGTGRAVVVRAIRTLTSLLAARRAGIGHLKMILQGDGAEVKLSIPTLEEPGWENQIPEFPGDQLRLLVNARVELDVQALRGLLVQAFDQPQVTARFGAGEAFHPQEPRPTHRMK